MNNENYYEKLKQNHPVFNDLNLDKGQQKRLESLLSYSSGAVNSLRNVISELSQDVIHSEEYKKERLNQAKAELQSTLDREFSVFKTKSALAKQELQAATHPQAKDSTEELLQFMQGKEIRDNLKSLPPAKRTEVLLDSVQRGDSTILKAIQAQPVTSDLVPSDVLDRASKTYAQKIAPQQTEAATLAEQDLQAAEKVRNLVQVAMGYIEQNL